MHRTVDIKIEAYISPERLVEEGEKAGLSNEAVEFLRHAEEVPLTIVVDIDSGGVISWMLRL